VKSYLLAAKIAAVFSLASGIFMSVTLHLFADMFLHPVLHGRLIAADEHDVFVVRVLWIWLVAMALMIAFSVYVTAPLRRMSRSMDRVAAGDMDHRVKVRGRDEGAVMGRSFNAMADRVRGMILGQKELMAGVSHELRSPLARMKVSLELLREGKGGAARIADLESEVDELDALVEELLLASRIDLGAVPLELATLDLGDLCDEAWARVAQAAERQGTTLALRCADDARLVLADRSLTVRLLGNLFVNSVRYAGPGPITVSAERRADRVHVTVADEGPGVETADLERLFEPFFRADRSRSRKTGAGGLGLMIVRRAVEAHGGSVRARLRSAPWGAGGEDSSAPWGAGGEDSSAPWGAGGENCSPRGLAVDFDLPAEPSGMLQGSRATG
jgi:signal transduction histidine kinase